jgi:hypothetical protein
MRPNSLVLAKEELFSHQIRQSRTNYAMHGITLTVAQPLGGLTIKYRGAQPRSHAANSGAYLSSSKDAML